MENSISFEPEFHDSLYVRPGRLTGFDDLNSLTVRLSGRPAERTGRASAMSGANAVIDVFSSAA